MRKLMQVSFIVVLIFVLAFGVIQLVTGTTAMAVAPDAVPNAGWNTQATGFMFGGDAQPNVSWNSKSTAFIGPALRPCVGWNSVGWNSVGWNSVGWNSVGWNSVGWNSDYWGQ